MIRLTCGSCQRKLSVKDELAGKKVKCPGCHQSVIVPPSAGAAAATPSEGVIPETVTATKHKPPVAADAEEASREMWDFLAPAQDSDEIGRLGAYRVLKILGAGGMGVVFQAEDPKLKRKVALKALLPVLAASETARKRFLREAQAAAAIEHDHIVSILHIGEQDGVPFIAMPLLKGEPLDKKLARDKLLSIAEVVRIGRETATGLAAAHAVGLVHRDIKPANLWLEGESGRVKILDFGLARAAAAGETQLTQQGAILGTPAFMAPEQAAGQEVDSRCDLFSLGCVLYRACTGRLPFKGADQVATLVAVASHNPDPPIELRPELPEALSDLVMQLLAKKPKDRPVSAQAVAEALEEIEGEAAGEAPAKDRPRREPEIKSQSSGLAKPKGSRIKEHRTPDGCTYRWPLPGARSEIWNYLPLLSSTLYLLYVTVQSLWLMPRALGIQNLLLAFGWPILPLVSLWRFFKPYRPESITLRTDSFRHDLGLPGGYHANIADYFADGFHQRVDPRPWWRQLLGLPLIVEISKDELGQIEIEKDPLKKIRLCYDFGVDRIQIGRYLPQREKEWLAAMIREWQEQGDEEDGEESGGDE